MVTTLNFGITALGFILPGMEHDDELDMAAHKSVEFQVTHARGYIADLEERLAACRRRGDEAAEISVLASLRRARAHLAECLAQLEGRN